MTSAQVVFTRRFGRIPVALGLIGYGAALTSDHLGLSNGATGYAHKLWPLLLIILGVEYLFRIAAVERRGSAEHSANLRFDLGGALLLLSIVFLNVAVLSPQSWLQTGWIPFSDTTLTRTETATYPVAGVEEVQVLIPAGSIEVRRSNEGGQVAVEAEYRVHGVAAQADRMEQALDRFRLRTAEGPILRLSVEQPSDVRSTIKYVLQLPPDLRFRAEAGSGSIRVQDHAGELDLSTGSGWIMAEDASGSLTARSGSGWIKIRDFDGPVEAQTGSGMISAEAVRGTVGLKSGSGGITVREFQGGALTATTGSGYINAGTSTPPEGDISLKAGSGAIMLRVPVNSNMTVEAKTLSGNVSGPDFLTRTRNGSIRTGSGTLGEGRHRVDLETGSGVITLAFQ
ncbi:MAG: DUF4097 family beta strand repeat protein [Firmicutes bacterium]|nr:DUF4097 family beta strand repeat protein [Bacillota bacterium]